MDNYSIYEFERDVTEMYDRGLRYSNNNNPLYAVEYCYLQLEGENDILTSLVIGKVALERTNKVFIGCYQLFKDAAEKYLNNKNILDLSDDEHEEVSEWAHFILEKLPDVTIEYNPIINQL